jgi:hypothetical protein
MHGGLLLWLLTRLQQQRGGRHGTWLSAGCQLIDSTMESERHQGIMGRWVGENLV